MDIRVSGHQVDTGSVLKETVSDRLKRLNEKYVARVTSATVVFGKGPRHTGFVCSITLNMPAHKPIVAKGQRCNEALLAFDQVVAKVEKQVRRIMRSYKQIDAAKETSGEF